MADAVTTQIIQDGPRNAIIKFTNVSDGSGESAVLKVDVSTLSGFNGRIPDEVQIRHIDYSLSGMQVQILWDADTDVLCWELTPDADNDLDFPYFLPNNAGAGKTGDIRFTTIGASNGDSYSIVLHLVKVYL
jgi:hypothetical protein